MSLTLTKAICRSLTKRPRNANYLVRMVERRGLSAAKDVLNCVNMTLYRLQAKGKVQKDGDLWSWAESVASNATEPKPKRKYTKRTKVESVGVTPNALANFFECAKKLGADKVKELLANKADYEAFYGVVASIGGGETARTILDVACPPVPVPSAN